MKATFCLKYTLVNQHSPRNGAFEDDSPIETQDIPASYVSLPEGMFIHFCHHMFVAKIVQDDYRHGMYFAGLDLYQHSRSDAKREDRWDKSNALVSSRPNGKLLQGVPLPLISRVITRISRVINLSYP